MLHNKKMISLLLFPILFFSCNTWKRTLRSGEVPVKKIWVGLMKGDWSHFKYCHYNLSDNDLSEIDLSPQEVYTMDSLSFMNFTVDSDIRPLIHLDKKRVTYYLKKSGKIIGAIDAGINAKNWYNEGGYGCIDSSLGEKILYRLNNNRLFLLKISVLPSYRLESTFNVYIDSSGKYMSLRIWGTSVPLEQEILALKNPRGQITK